MKPADLKRMVKDLLKLGHTQDQIGAAIGRDQSTVSDLANGRCKRPLYETVEALKKFHAAEMARAAKLAA